MRVTTWPAFFIRYSSRRNSRGCSGIAWLGARDGVAEAVEFEIADAIDGFGRARLLPAAERLDPRQQFGEGIGLGQVVVAAGSEAGDPVVDLAEGGQEQRRRLVAALAQLLDDGQAVALGQHAVDDQHVVAAVGRPWPRRSRRRRRDRRRGPASRRALER